MTPCEKLVRVILYFYQPSLLQLYRGGHDEGGKGPQEEEEDARRGFTFGIYILDYNHPSPLTMFKQFDAQCITPTKNLEKSE